MSRALSLTLFPLSLRHPLSLPIYIIFLLTHLSTFQPIYLSSYLSVYLPIYLSLCCHSCIQKYPIIYLPYSKVSNDNMHNKAKFVFVFLTFLQLLTLIQITSWRGTPRWDNVVHFVYIERV